MSRSSRIILIPLLALWLSGTGCLFRTKRIDPPPTTLLDASLDELIEKLERFSEIQSMKATVDLQLSYLNDEMNKQTQVRDVRGFILARRPNQIRIQAQVPVTGQRAFDMATDGGLFQVYLPWKSRFFQGDAALQKRSKKRMQNIRPQHILEPLLLKPPRESELPALDREQIGVRSFYVVQLLVEDQNGFLRIARKAWFDRATLDLTRLEIRDREGQTVTRALYREWDTSLDVPYARSITVSRPLDGYDLSIRFIEPGLNEDVPDDAFALEPPKGIEVEIVGEDDEEEEGVKVTANPEETAQ